eukprot:Rmarinus@m.18958
MLSKRTASVSSSVVNLCNTILGSGILGLPYAFSETGMALAWSLLLLSALGASFALHTLNQCGKFIPGMSNYHDLAAATFPRAALLIDGAVFIKCIGVATSYLIIIGDIMPDILDDVLPALNVGIMRTREFWITFTMIFVLVPLATLPTINALRFTSILALLAVSYLMVVVVAFAAIPSLDPCDGKPDCRGEVEWVSVNDHRILAALPVYIFSFTCHQNAPAVYSELSDPTPRRLAAIATLPFALAFSASVLVATCGYAVFGDKVASTVIDSYPSGKVIALGRFLLCVLVALSYPLQAHPARSSVFSLYRGHEIARRKGREQYHPVGFDISLEMQETGRSSAKPLPCRAGNDYKRALGSPPKLYINDSRPSESEGEDEG